ICPLGTIGEWTALAGRKLGIRPRELPPSVDRPLRWLKYIGLAAIITGTWRLGTLVLRDFDPWVAWMHLSAGWAEVAERPWAYVALFGLVIGASLFIERFWCRYLCPLGASLAPLQKLALIKIRRDRSSCVVCGACQRDCPVGLDPMATEKVTSAECLACGRCVEACPVERTLFFGLGRKTLSVTVTGLLGLALFFGGYGLARGTSLWRTSASLPGEAQTADPAEALYGWMSVNQIAETVGLTAEEIIAAGGLPADIDRDLSVKKVEGVDDEELKERISLYLRERSEDAASPPADKRPNPDEIRGSQTLRDLAALYGLDPASTLENSPWPADASRDVPIKELKDLYGTELDVIRDAVKKLIGQ
ncbi:MAG: 4Fe-4S binding protein, partial [Clostridia bacterium]|nr:4Fe-4S binding protein [Clostridia bacterium]